mmetsp:Transcript_38703/g.75561  ORF Transcript_38703/g.75561 Transcript_38703/m.75561 type:complete len:102 (-) Transcript_38703:217-522(-)
MAAERGRGVVPGTSVGGGHGVSVWPLYVLVRRIDRPKGGTEGGGGRVREEAPVQQRARESSRHAIAARGEVTRGRQGSRHYGRGDASPETETTPPTDTLKD